MQIKKTSLNKSLFPPFIANNRFVLLFLMIVIIGLSFMACLWFLDKSYIVYYMEKGKNLFLSQAEQIRDSETYLQKENGLPTLSLDIPFDSLEQIKQKRVEAINTGVLLSTDEDLVNAKAILDNGATVKIEMRLKGDWVDHIESQKWSYRIHAKGDGQILGMTNFSIQSPDTRQFLYEWAYHKHLIEEGILTTRYSFINVVENGEFKGVYAIEESFTTELIESQQSRAGIILRFDEDSLWINRANFIEDSHETYNLALTQGLFMVTEMEQARIEVFQSKSVTEDPVLKEEAQTAISLLRGYQNGSLSAAQVFDIEKFGRFLAITDFWASNHATYWHNLRFYYNPVTSLLEPVAYDGDTARYPSSSLAKIFGEEAYFKDAAIRRSYAAELERLTSQEYLLELEKKLSDEITPFQSALLEEYGETLISTPWRFLESRRILMQNQIHPPFPVQGVYAIDKQGISPILTVKLNNLMILPVRILGVEIITNDQTIYIDESQLDIKGDLLQSTVYPEINFIGAEDSIPAPQANISVSLFSEQFSALQTSEINQYNAVVQISGVSETHRIPLMLDSIEQNIINRPQVLFANADDVFDQHPYLIKQDEQTIIIESGDWTVTGDLIIPEQYRLIIMPGTTLRFDEEAILLTSNRILAKGTEANPIHLTASQNHWAGIVVLSAEQKSILNYTMIENTASINREGWILTGGVTFYESPVRIFYTSFTDHIGEDALNIIHSEYELVYVKFSNSASDALDTDFSDGLIEHCSFNQIDGDAIDVSGSKTTIKDTVMTMISDKAVSAGENSIVNITGITIDTANIGIASKDLSIVNVNEIDLKHISLAGFAAYIKKPVFGPATIVGKYVMQTDVEILALVQTGSSVTLDEQPIDTQDLDVSVLYDLGILGN
ncbi:MAG: hypothetical protein JEZ00_16895 [Anaerolineaceae bacterium]|nr:hypothetical protein [Anaerolineaceae bacterium]